MYSCNTESLYISVLTELGLEGIKYWIIRKKNLIPQRLTKKCILELIEFILKKDNFLFDPKMFNQTFATAMGIKCALLSHHWLSRRN